MKNPSIYIRIEGFFYGQIVLLWLLYIWYDNEYGYSHEVIRLAKYISKVRRYTYY